jgi:hypothetical protein
METKDGRNVGIGKQKEKEKLTDAPEYTALTSFDCLIHRTTAKRNPS